MRILTTLACATLCILIGLQSQDAAAQQKAPKRAITKIAGDLYRFQNNFHFSVFLVTPDGVIATDPINADAAKWLKDEIAKRFGKPIKYLIYSHDHRDHIAGGEVFADTATIVAHEKTRATIIGEKRPTAVPNVTFKRPYDAQLRWQDRGTDLSRPFPFGQFDRHVISGRAGSLHGRLYFRQARCL